MAEFLTYFKIRHLTFTDVLDICIIWVVLYYLFRFMRGRPTVQIALGLFSLFLARILAEFSGLIVVSMTISWLFNVIPFAVIVLFQDEIRTVLASIGTNPFYIRDHNSRNSTLDNVFAAVLTLARTNVGALIVFEQDQGLRTYMETGSRLDALPNTELLLDIFLPKNNLHDGAVIISKSRIAAAGCIMPLARGQDLPKNYGTRHRAAIGISEETDCIAVIVSEETGRISLTKAGQIYVLKERNLVELYETYNGLVRTESSEQLDQLKSFTRKPFLRLGRNKKTKSSDSGSTKGTKS